MSGPRRRHSRYRKEDDVQGQQEGDGKRTNTKEEEGNGGNGIDGQNKKTKEPCPYCKVLVKGAMTENHRKKRHMALHRKMRGAPALEVFKGHPAELASPSPAVCALFVACKRPTNGINLLYTNGCNFCCRAGNCHFLAVTLEEMVAHIRVVHNPPEYVDCPYCFQTHKDKVQLIRHCSAKHREKHKRKKLSLSPKKRLQG